MFDKMEKKIIKVWGRDILIYRRKVILRINPLS